MKDEEIIAAAKAAGQKTEFGELVRSPLVGGTFSAYEIGFIEGAEWAREQKEQNPNIELIQRSWYMEGYHDREFGKEPKWILKTGEGGPKHELNPRYGQPLADEQKSAENGKELLYVSNKSYKIGYRDGKRDAEQKQKGGKK